MAKVSSCSEGYFQGANKVGLKMPGHPGLILFFFLSISLYSSSTSNSGKSLELQLESVKQALFGQEPSTCESEWSFKVSGQLQHLLSCRQVFLQSLLSPVPVTPPHLIRLPATALHRQRPPAQRAAVSLDTSTISCQMCSILEVTKAWHGSPGATLACEQISTVSSMSPNQYTPGGPGS